jgi:hypothetical protein
VFDGKLWMAFIANNSTNGVLVCSSDGVHWSGNAAIGEASNGTAPSLAVFNNALWVAFIANNSANGVVVCSSSDGVNWSGNTDIGQASQSAPSLAAFDFYPGGLGVYVPEQSALFVEELGSLAALGLNQAVGRWLWSDQGTPTGTTVTSDPGRCWIRRMPG